MYIHRLRVKCLGGYEKPLVTTLDTKMLHDPKYPTQTSGIMGLSNTRGLTINSSGYCASGPQHFQCVFTFCLSVGSSLHDYCCYGDIFYLSGGRPSPKGHGGSIKDLYKSRCFPV